MSRSLLLGSGISIPAGMPGTWDITNEILNNCDNWYKEGTQYRFKKYSGQNDEYFIAKNTSSYMQKIYKFIKMISEEIEEYYYQINESDVSPNYEEIFDYIFHIRMALTQDIDNPLLLQSIINLQNKVEFINPNNTNKNEELRLICDEAITFIKSVIYFFLQKNYSSTNYLQIISDLIKSQKVVNLATLNHDLILEDFLRRNLIEYYDGFQTNEINGVRVWENNFDKSKLSLLKLHGSINWFSIRDNEEKHWQKVLIEQWQGDTETEVQINDTLYYAERLPYFLTGTNDKHLQYNYSLFLEMFHQFHRQLSQTEVLIIAGYGFGDMAVNFRVINWFYEKNNRKIEIITPSIANTMTNARGAIHARSIGWESDVRVNWIENRIENVKISDFKFL